MAIKQKAAFFLFILTIKSVSVYFIFPLRSVLLSLSFLLLHFSVGRSKENKTMIVAK